MSLQAAQSKKGKAAEKSPAEETARPLVTAAATDADVVKKQIEAQGQKVREMKASGAAKVMLQTPLVDNNVYVVYIIE